MLQENLMNNYDYDYDYNNNITSKNRRKCTSNEIDGIFTIIFLYLESFLLYFHTLKVLLLYFYNIH